MLTAKVSGRDNTRLSASCDQQGLRGGANGIHIGIVDGGTNEADPLVTGIGVQVNRGLRVDERPHGGV